MDTLKLLALDEEDLAIISAHLQDAVVNGGRRWGSCPAPSVSRW